MEYTSCVDPILFPIQYRQALETAEEGGGDMEVLDAQFEKAKMYARIGDKVAAYAAYNTIAEKAKISTGKKIDAVMAKTRVALFHMDTPQASSRSFSLFVWPNFWANSGQRVLLVLLPCLSKAGRTLSVNRFKPLSGAFVSGSTIA